MTSSTPEPESRLDNSDTPAPVIAPGPPAPRVGPVRPRPLPRAWVIWLTIVLLGWFCGLGLVVGIVRSIQGISRSRKRNVSPVRYVVPLVFAVAVVVALVVIGVLAWRSPDSGAGGFVIG